MILNIDTTIDIEALFGALRRFDRLHITHDLGADESLLDDGLEHERASTIDGFVDALACRPEDEARVRDALVYVLNLSPERFAALARPRVQLRPRGPYQDLSDFRRWLEYIWAQVWADWRVRDFDADDYEIRPSAGDE